MGLGLGKLFSFVTKIFTAFNPFVTIGAIVLGFMFAKSMKKKRQKAMQAATAGISGVLITKQGTNEPIPVIYGERRVAGARVFIEASGTDGDTKNAYFHMVETIAEGPIEGLQEIYFNDELVATSSDNGATIDYSAGSTDFSAHAATKFFDGSQSARVSGTLLGQSISSNWPSGAVGNKLAYVYTVLKWNQDRFGSGVPTITYKVKGKKVPALGSNQSSTLTYSDNPALCIHDYLTSTLYGKAIDHTLLDADPSSSSFKTVKDYCDQTVAKTASDSTAVTRYTVNEVVDTDTRMLDNIEDLLSTCRGGLITNEKYKLIVDKPETPLTTIINDDHIIGNITFTQASKKTLTNRLRCTYPNEAGDINFQDDIVVLESTGLQSSDGLVLNNDMVLSGVTNKERVLRILNEELNQSRQSGQLSVQVDPSLIDIGVYDVVKFTNTTFGQTNKLYRVMQTVLNPDNTITLNMREYDANVYWDNNKTFITNNKDDTDY